jgi:hypothetical protein
LPRDDELFDAYLDHYRPEGPFAMQCVLECVRSQGMLDRAAGYQEAILRDRAERLRNGGEEGGNDIQSLITLFYKYPYAAIDRMRLTADGCAWIADCWGELSEPLEAGRRWTPSQLKLAEQLVKTPGDWDRLADDPDGWRLAVLTRLVRGDRHPMEIDVMRYLAPHVIPPGYEDVFNPAALPTVEEGRELLRAYVREQHQGWSEESARLAASEAADAADPDQEPEPDPALAGALFDDEKPMRLYLRYHAEARVSLYRAHDQLLKSLEYDRKNPPQPPASTPAAEPETATSRPAPAEQNDVFRNEPEPHAKTCPKAGSVARKGSRKNRRETPGVVSHENPLESPR